MHRNPATKPLVKVPGHSHLFRRGARYYFRIGVPQNLRPIVGRRELVKSLDTADYNLALERISLEEQSCREILRVAKARLQAKPAGPQKSKYWEPLIVTSEKHAMELARQWFLELERDGAQWWMENRREISRADRAELLMDLWLSQNAITGEKEGEIHPTNYNDGKLEVRSYFRTHMLPGGQSAPRPGGIEGFKVHHL